MKRKKLLCIALASVFAMSAGLLAACGDSDDGEEGSAELKPVSELYPDESKFDFEPLYNNGQASDAYGTHDPVMVEAFDNGKAVYYAFSTDNITGGIYGVQVRKSDDMVEWEKVGAAIKGFSNVKSDAQVEAHYKTGNSEIDEVYQIVKNYPDFSSSGPCYTLWAPDVIPAPTNTGKTVNGGWWLYSCWTAGFGSSQSVIFKLKSDNVAGPYEYEGIVVQHDVDNDDGINEIDPSVYWDKDGNKLYMSYGSFFGGFKAVELSTTTGLRANNEDPKTPGTMILSAGTAPWAEGSAIAYHNVDVYTGDIGAADEDASKWEKQGKYYMMGSDGALAYNYSMRTWTSDSPMGPFTSVRGSNGLQIGGTWSWTKEGDPVVKDLNYFIPGHNDMLTTKDGRNLIIYHTRVVNDSPSFPEGEHFLYTSLFDFNSKGQIVINPNRYAGERVGLVTAEDVMSLTNGKYSVIKMQSYELNYTTKATINYAQDCEFHADGTITGAVEGTWKVYGTHYVYIKLADGTEYYGTAMPAYIRQYAANGLYKWTGHGGLTISAVTDTTDTGTAAGNNGILYFNMQF